MSVYEKTIKTLLEAKTLTSHIIALGKIKASTEDDQLFKAIDAAIHDLQTQHLTSKSKSTPVSLDNTKLYHINLLGSYCKKAIGTKKPEWQILAEKNGWEPPSKI